MRPARWLKLSDQSTGTAQTRSQLPLPPLVCLSPSFFFTNPTFIFLLGVHQKVSESVPSLPSLRDSVYCLTTAPGDKQFAVMSEVLKILFNQTIHWHEDSDVDDVSII